MNGDSVAIKNAALRHIVDNNGSGYANLAAWTTWWNELLLNATRPYFIYTAFITQTGTAAPVASVLENTIGSVAWSYYSVGTYLLTKNGAFVSGKTVPDKLESYIDDSGNKYTLERTSANVMTLKTYAAADTSVLANAVLSGQYVNIQVYE